MEKTKLSLEITQKGRTKQNHGWRIQPNEKTQPIWLLREKKLLMMQLSTLTFLCGKSCKELKPKYEKFP